MKSLVNQNEEVWVEYFDFDHNLRFIMSSDKNRNTYFLYEVNDGKAKKLGKGSNPAALEEKYKVNDIISKQ